MKCSRKKCKHKILNKYSTWIANIKTGNYTYCSEKCLTIMFPWWNK